MAIDPNTTLNFRGTGDLKRAFQLVLRGIFADETIIKDKRYRYVSVRDEKSGKLVTAKETKIRIYRAFPQRLEHYPTIVVTAGAHSPNLTGMGVGKEELGEQFDDQGVLIGQSATGHTVIPIVLNIHTKSSQDDRDNLRDLLVQIFRVLGQRSFFRFGIGYSAIDAADDTQTEDDDGKIIFTTAVTVHVNTDYVEALVIDPLKVNLIDKISIDVLGRRFQDSTPEPLHQEPPFNP